MGWKSLPKWARILSMVSILLIVLFSILSIFVFSNAEEAAILGLIIFMSYAGIILVMWLLGLLNGYLVSTNKKWLANVLTILLPGGVIGYFAWAFTWQVTQRPENLGSFSENSFFLIPLLFVIIYFVVSLVLINKKRY